MADAGRPTELTDELIREIKQCILDGKNIKETANACGINVNTFYAWTTDNYLNISDKIEGWRRDRKLILADITSDTIQTLPVFDDTGKLDKELLKIKQKEAEFIRETLGKQHYSKRNELTGADGGDIKVAGFNFIIPNENNNTDNKSTTETIPSVAETS